MTRLAVVVLFLAGCAPIAHNADFYECGPNRTLAVCAIGTVPSGECKHVGSGVVANNPAACN